MSLSSPQKVVLITGSSQGLGRAIAIKFAQASTHLIVCADLHPGRKPPTHVYTPPRLQDPSNLEDTAGAAPKYQDDRPPHTSSAGPSNPSSNSPILHSGLKDHDGDDDPEIPTHELICERYGERKAIYIQCDVSKEEGKGGMQGAIEEAIREGGKLIVVVNAASVPILDIKSHEMTSEEWEQAMSVHARGGFLGSKHALRQFLSQEPDNHGERGCIVNISSVAGYLGIFECSAYCSSKAAILGLTRALAIEYASKGIRCNAVAAGYIDSSMLSPFLAQPEFAAYLHTVIPAQRLGRANDVANAAVWLGNSAESGYINGVVLPVDGGFSAR